MQDFIRQITQVVAPHVPRVGSALAILVLGWIVALVAAAIVRGALRRTELDNRLVKWLSPDGDEKGIDIENWMGKAIYYLIMLFVLVAVFQTVGLTMLTEPLNGLLTQVFEFAPRILSAGILLLVAWILASGVKLVVTRAFEATRLDEWVAGEAGHTEEEQASLGNMIGEALYWFIFLIFLPGVLGALALEGMLDPVNGMVNRITGFLPNLLTAAFTLVIGWFLARVIKRVASNFLAAVGLDGLGERLGISKVLGQQTLSGLLGMILYVLIFLPILITALSALELDAITQPLSNVLNLILEFIPVLFAAALLLAVSYVVGRLVAGLVTNLLAGLGLNTILARLGLGKEIGADERAAPSKIVGTLVLAAIMLFAATEAASLLGFATLSEVVNEFLAFSVQIIVGLAILGIGMFLANLAADTIRASGSQQAAFLATISRVAILALTGAMALRRMGLANEIISLAFGLTLGAVAIAVAIAFGIGGREVAARQLDRWAKSLGSDDSKHTSKGGGTLSDP